VKSIFAFLSFFFSLMFYIPYAWSIQRDDATKPTLSTWFMWFLNDLVILSGIILNGTIVWQMVAYTLGSLIILCICIRKKVPFGNWTTLDYMCLGILLLALLLSFFAGPNEAIFWGLVAFTVGTIPLTINLWNDPSREPLFPWIVVLFGGFFGVLAIPSNTIADALTPIWMFLIQIGIVLLICRKFFLQRFTAH
jgi:hypothetical protein